MKHIELTQNQVAIVDECDYEELNKYRWYAHFDKRVKSYYAKRNSKTVNGRQKNIRMHRVLLGAKKGDQVDHINRNTLDNRRCNIRIVTNSENQRNRSLQSNNSSGYTGVCWAKREGKWMVRINSAIGKEIFLGYYDTLLDAVCARKNAEKEYNYHLNHGKCLAEA